MAVRPTDLQTPEQEPKLTTRRAAPAATSNYRLDGVRRLIHELKTDATTLAGARDHSVAAFSQGVAAAVGKIDAILATHPTAHDRDRAVRVGILDLRRDPLAFEDARARCADCFSRGVKAAAAALDTALAQSTHAD